MNYWHYNRFGHVELWYGSRDEREADNYLQVDTDVEAFFESIGEPVPSYSDVSGEWKSLG